MDKLFVSIILVNFNGLQHTRNAIASILRHSAESEIIVVDNGSTDGSGKSLSGEFPFVKLIALKENKGFGAGNNRGAEVAMGKFLFFLNNDTLLLEDTPRILASVLDENSEIGACGPKLVNPGGKFQPSFGLDPSILNEWRARRTHHKLRNRDKAYASFLEQRYASNKVDWVTGAALMVRKEVFEKVSGFDEKFFMYFEDADLCRRVRNLGLVIRYVPTTTVIHFLGISAKKKAAKVSHEYRKSQIYYYEKHRSIFSRMLLRFYLFFRIASFGFPTFSGGKVIAVPQKLLIVKLCCLGDVVFLTPALRALRGSFPSTRLTYLAASWIRDIVEQISYVDDLVIFDAPYWQRRWLAKLYESIRLLMKLRRERYDVMIVGHRNKLFAVLGWLARIPVRVGFASPTNRFLTNPVDFDPRIHEIKRYLDLTEEIGAFSDHMETEIEPHPDECKKVDALLLSWGLREDDLLVGILAGGGENPGTTMPIKRWGAEFYGALCKKILAAYPSTILLLGGPQDIPPNTRIQNDITRESHRVRNVAGEISLRSLPALLRRCHVVIGGDSGPTHIAAAVGSKTIFLFGPSDPRLVAPRKSNSVYLWKHVHCSPCYTPDTVLQKKYYNGNTFICWTGTHECLETLTVDEVFSTFQGMVATIAKK